MTSSLEVNKGDFGYGFKDRIMEQGRQSKNIEDRRVASGTTRAAEEAASPVSTFVRDKMKQMGKTITFAKMKLGIEDVNVSNLKDLIVDDPNKAMGGSYVEGMNMLADGTIATNKQLEEQGLPSGARVIDLSNLPEDLKNMDYGSAPKLQEKLNRFDSGDVVVIPPGGKSPF